MPLRKSIVIGIGVAAAGFFWAFVVAVSDWRCPIVLTVIASEPSGMLDDSGSEFQLVTVRLNNGDSGRLTLAEEGIHGEAKVGNHWVDAEVLSNVLDVARHRDLLILIPSGAESCRLSIEYLPEPINLKLLHLCGSLGLRRLSWWPAVAQRCFPARWLEPVRSDYIGTGRSWKHIRPEVPFSRQKARSDILLQGHNDRDEQPQRISFPRQRWMWVRAFSSGPPTSGCRSFP